MNNYYYTVQPIKQNAQLLPLIVSSSQPLMRGSLTDRTLHEFRNAHSPSPNPHPAPASHLHPPVLTRESSAKHLHDLHQHKPDPSNNQAQKYSGGDYARTFSDYQMNLTAVRHEKIVGEDSQLPNGGGMNITANKLAEKVKQKSEQKANSKVTNSVDWGKTPLTRNGDSTVESNEGKGEGSVEWLGLQLAKLRDRMGRNEQKLQQLQRSCKKDEASMGQIVGGGQYQEINKILSLVEKVQNRDDYRKSIKMIEELRVNILELHTEIKNIKQQHSEKEEKQESQQNDNFKEEMEAIRKKTAKETLELNNKMEEIQLKLKEWRKLQEEDWNASLNSSVKKFQGKMITLNYEQRISVTSPSTNSIYLNLAKLSHKSSEISCQKQNNSSSILTTKTYYLDNEGYLLDKNKYYLVNRKNEQIRLTDREIDLLRKHNVL